MKLYALNSGYFKLDGGAMFGVVPKSLWHRQQPADENNMCSWAMRCLLIEKGNQLILIDTGIGNKQDDKFFGHYYLHGNDSLIGHLNRLGFNPSDVTDVVLTHLHFDHCGGAIERNDQGQLLPAFKNARFWSHQSHWQWATKPNAREKASFLSENILPIQESGQLNLLESLSFRFEVPELGLEFFLVNGHTEAQMLPIVKYQDKTLVFMADLMPSSVHVPLPYVMGYDVRPLLTMEEKSQILKEAAENNYILLLEHDPKFEACTVQMSERGPRLLHTGNLTDFL